MAPAAMRASNHVMEFPCSIIPGFGGGYQPVVGFNWGAKHYDRLSEVLRLAMPVRIPIAVHAYRLLSQAEKAQASG